MPFSPEAPTESHILQYNTVVWSLNRQGFFGGGTVCRQVHCTRITIEPKSAFLMIYTCPSASTRLKFFGRRTINYYYYAPPCDEEGWTTMNVSSEN